MIDKCQLTTTMRKAKHLNYYQALENAVDRVGF